MRNTAFFTFSLSLLLFYSCANEEPLPEHVTYAEHIAPLVYEKCAPCHRPDGAAPFSLLTYDDAKRKAKTMAAVTKMRFMPPWPADHDYRDFLGEKRLTKHEIDLIQKWYAQGAPSGDLATAPAPHEYPKGSAVGVPDYVAKMEPFPIKGDNTDRFLMVKIPYQLPQDTFT